MRYASKTCWVVEQLWRCYPFNCCVFIRGTTPQICGITKSDGWVYIYICICVCIYIYIYIKICAYVALFSSRGSLHERAQMAALCLVLCHLVDKYVTQVAVLTEKGGRNKGLKSLEERKKAFKDEYKKRGFPPWITWALPPVKFMFGALLSCGRFVCPVFSFSPLCQLCCLSSVPASFLCDITASLNKSQYNVFRF